ncbi:MAG: hypothetical protein JNL72_12655 [Flavipsychrobacter sp.]|nr:hypothetical protein [Flavipsychrobacter sp.]
MMPHLQRYVPALVTTAALGLLVYLLYPYYGGCLDADSIAYLTIARRYAAGDVATAINGYWSPWSCWLVALLLKSGLQPIPSAIIIDTLAAAGIVALSQSFFLRFSLGRVVQWLMGAALTLFLCYAVYLQWFADLWMCFFLLALLRITVSERFAAWPGYWIAGGIAGGLAYYAKAYALPFVVLQTAAFAWMARRDADRSGRIKGLLTIAGLTLVMAFGWVLALHQKYDTWTIGTAGSLNTSWVLNGKQYWKDEYRYLVPPAHPGSPYLWEDPYLVGKVMPYQGTAAGFARSQAMRVVYNLSKMGTDLGALSPFLMLAILFGLALVLSARIRSHFPARLELLSASMLLLPLGYTVVVSEERYLWYMVPLSMVPLALLLAKAMRQTEPRVYKAALYLLALCYVCHPVMKLKEMYRNGLEDRQIADALQRAGLKGGFTGNPQPGAEKERVIRLSYYMDDFHYYHPINAPSHEQLMAEMSLRKVKYYLHFAREADGAGYQPRNSKGHPLPEVPLDIKTNFRIFYDID